VIIDYQKNAAHATLFSVYDAKTAENLDHLHIFYADDSAGVFKSYKKISDGNINSFEVDPATREPIVVVTERKIKIVRKA